MRVSKETPIEEVKRVGDRCGRCGKCCSYGSGFVLESEIPRIASFLKIPKDKFIKDFLNETEIFHTTVFKIRSLPVDGKPYGPCTFLKKDLCSIHDIKPLHCSMCNCSEHGDDLNVWFMVNHCLNVYDPESVRQYCSYVETGGRVIPGAEVEKLFHDEKLLKQIKDYDRFR
ncbi:YkgJ family cysteine cluster protein [Candidatus Woesearchaeota archaeon]|nr:YkgJ family cysteine cluster protein [Candidatus Woesearchaeota archaeon]